MPGLSPAWWPTYPGLQAGEPWLDCRGRFLRLQRTVTHQGLEAPDDGLDEVPDEVAVAEENELPDHGLDDDPPVLSKALEVNGSEVTTVLEEESLNKNKLKVDAKKDNDDDIGTNNYNITPLVADMEDNTLAEEESDHKLKLPVNIYLIFGFFQ